MVMHPSLPTAPEWCPRTYPKGVDEDGQYLRLCKGCGSEWRSNHCPCDRHQRPCVHCGTRAEPLPQCPEDAR